MDTVLTLESAENTSEFIELGNNTYMALSEVQDVYIKALEFESVRKDEVKKYMDAAGGDFLKAQEAWEKDNPNPPDCLKVRSKRSDDGWTLYQVEGSDRIDLLLWFFRQRSVTLNDIREMKEEAESEVQDKTQLDAE